MKKKDHADNVWNNIKGLYTLDQTLLDYNTRFELLIAVILSARTTDAGVNKITPRLFALYPDAVALAEAPQHSVETIIHSTGFYRAKAANIIAASKMLVERYVGQVPEEMSELTDLPGVGRKTANVIRGALWKKPAIIVDTHFRRVCQRLNLTENQDPDKIEKDLKKLIPEENQTSFSMAINRHGRKYCKARKPDCINCPLNQLCPSAEGF